MSVLSYQNILITIGDYPLSWIEFAGTLLYFASVWLIARKRLSTWPVGIASVILYGILFWQIRLYSDCLEQVYYLVVSIWGWISWNATKRKEASIPTGFSAGRAIGAWIGVTVAAGAGLGLVMSRIHLWLPLLFPEPASFPYLDALTTVASFVAMFLLTRRRAESWVYWILVDIAAIWLYWVKGLRFIAAQYVFLLVMAVYGLWRWASKERSRARAEGVADGE